MSAQTQQRSLLQAHGACRALSASAGSMQDGISSGGSGRGDDRKDQNGAASISSAIDASSSSSSGSGGSCSAVGSSSPPAGSCSSTSIKGASSSDAAANTDAASAPSSSHDMYMSHLAIKIRRAAESGSPKDLLDLSSQYGHLLSNQQVSALCKRAQKLLALDSSFQLDPVMHQLAAVLVQPVLRQQQERLSLFCGVPQRNTGRAVPSAAAQVAAAAEFEAAAAAAAAAEDCAAAEAAAAAVPAEAAAATVVGQQVTASSAAAAAAAANAVRELQSILAAPQQELLGLLEIRVQQLQQQEQRQQLTKMQQEMRQLWQQVLAAYASVARTDVGGKLPNALWGIANALPQDQPHPSSYGSNILALGVLAAQYGFASPQIIRNTLHSVGMLALAKMQVQLPEQQLLLLLVAFLAKVDSATPQQISDVLQAVDRVGMQVPKQLRQLLGTFLEQVDSATPQPSSRLDMFLTKLRVQLSSIPQAISNTLWAAGQL